MSARGTFFRLAYRLRRHLFFTWSLARWLATLWLIAVAWALMRWWPNFWPGAALGLLFVVYMGWLVWAQRSGYVYFERLPDPAALLESEPSPQLLKEELVPARASGWFTVEGADAYMIDLDADFETVGTREHIVLARRYRSRFLFLGRWPSYQVGWWYMFFMPGMIRRLRTGRLHAGREPAPAIEIVYAPDEETEHTIYLAFDDPRALRRVWDDLLLDAPADVGVTGEEHAA